MTTHTSALNELLEPVGRCLTPDVARKLIDLRASDAVQKRMERFAAKSTDGTLSENERAEYESLVSAGTFISVLQSKARTLLQESSESS